MLRRPYDLVTYLLDHSFTLVTRLPGHSFTLVTRLLDHSSMKSNNDAMTLHIFHFCYRYNEIIIPMCSTNSRHAAKQHRAQRAARGA